MSYIWFQRSTHGMNIFSNVAEAYYDIHNVYPTTNIQMPEFLTSIGFPCEEANAYFPGVIAGEECMVEAKGLQMDDEIATALILRFGYKR